MGGGLPRPPTMLRRMSVLIRSITVDCGDAHALARFWAAALGWNVYFDDDPEVLVAPTFPPVAGPDPAVHPGARTAHPREEPDACRPLADGRHPGRGGRAPDRCLGATVVEDHRTDKGGGWVWMAARPGGNDFCVERSAAERGSPPARSFKITT